MTTETVTTRSYTQTIQAPPEAVFPLLCPVREAEWLDGWTYDLIHSVSGLAEEGCVFRTHPSGEPETIWLITRHDPARGIVEFARVTEGLVATRLAVQVEPSGPGRSAVRVTYHFVPTSEAGARFIRERHSEESFRRSMGVWERSMNHFVETGALLREGGPERKS